MLEEGPGKSAAHSYGMYLLDVRHMSREMFDSFSKDLQAFFGFLIYEHSRQLVNFVNEREDQFRKLPAVTLDALIEITKSSRLKQLRQEEKGQEGAIDVCEGIELYAQEVARKAVAQEREKTERAEKAVIQEREKTERAEKAAVQEREKTERAEKALAREKEKTESTFFKGTKLLGNSIEKAIDVYIEMFHTSREEAEQKALRYW